MTHISKKGLYKLENEQIIFNPNPQTGIKTMIDINIGEAFDQALSTSAKKNPLATHRMVEHEGWPIPHKLAKLLTDTLEEIKNETT